MSSIILDNDFQYFVTVTGQSSPCFVAGPSYFWSLVTFVQICHSHSSFVPFNDFSRDKREKMRLHQLTMHQGIPEVISFLSMTEFPSLCFSMYLPLISCCSHFGG